MITTLRKPVTLEDYRAIPWEGGPVELVNGQVIEMPEPTKLHADIVNFLTVAINILIQSAQLRLVCRSQVSVDIAAGTSRRPDLIVCTADQWGAIDPAGGAYFAIGNPPALAIEVCSPDNKGTDLIDKRDEYALAGISEYWIVNPLDDYVRVLVLDNQEYREQGEYRGDDEIHSPLLPGLGIRVNQLLTSV
ncbi:MAG: Uma2 family endonuclease [Cyanobacteria bacterium J06635_1]